MENLNENEVSIEEEMSIELINLLQFIRNILIEEYPVKDIDIDYFIFAALQQKSNLLYRIIEEEITSSALDTIEEAYHKYINSKSLSVIKPGRNIGLSETMKEFLMKAKDEAEALKSDKVSSIHILLAILHDENPNNKIRKIFTKAGLSYNTIQYRLTNEDDNDNIEEEDNNEFFNNVIEEVDENSGIKIIRVNNLSELPKSPKDFVNMIRNKVSSTQGKQNKGEKNTYIPKYCINLNNLVERGKIEPLIGREKEVNSVIRILARKKKNNVIIVGGEGVGKTAIAESIAYKIVNKQVPNFLKGKKIISLDMTSLMAGTTLRGMFEERVKGIMDEIKKDKNYILMIDNIGDAMADKGKNDFELSSILSNSLENGEIRVIGTSDFKSYRKTFDKDQRLARRFQKIIIEAPTLEESISILNGAKSAYENFHMVSYTDEAIKCSVKLSNTYITEKNLPDSAIDIIDEAGAMYGTVIDNDEIIKKQDEIDSMLKNIKSLKKKDKYTEADDLTLLLNDKMVELTKIKCEYEKSRKENPIIITEKEILEVLSLKTGIPINELTSDDKKKLSELNERLKSEIIGQDEQIDTICRSLKRNRVGLRNGGCMYSALMIAKTGVGKTLTAKRLAKEMFGNEDALVRFDMSEYPDKSAVNKLIGSNPGYIGYEDGGQLTEAIKNKKYCVLLLDEIEKADSEVYNIFLQVLDEGFLTDNSGMKVDFKNVIVLFTSNVGAKTASDFGTGIGFVDDKTERTKNILGKELKNRFPPEFLNRIDNILYFNSLTDEDLKTIVKLEMKNLINRVKNINYDFKYNDDVLEYILDIAKKEKEFGARPIKRAIQENIEDKITDVILEKEDIQNGYIFESFVENDNIIVR